MELEDDILDTSLLKLDGDFNAQVDYILRNVRLSRAEVENLRWLFSDLEQTLQRAWPGCLVMPFGSIVTGLGIKTSDADCYVSIPNHLQVPGDKYVMQAKYTLMKYSSNFRELFAITEAKVPIVKCYHVPTNCHCDVSFTSISGIRNSQLISLLLHTDTKTLPLAVLIKYWSKVHDLTGTNKLPNYTLTMMVIFYLQQLKVLPSVIQLQTNKETIMVDGWNTSFNWDLNFESTNNMSLYKLLGGFFEYYNNFDFKQNIVSPYLGTPLSVESFKEIRTVPKQFVLYKQNVINGVCKPFNVKATICIQDPFDHSRNTSGGVYRRMADSFLSQLKYAAVVYKECSENKFLEAILVKKLNISHPIGNNMNTVNMKRPSKIRKRNKKNKHVHNNIQSVYIEMNKLMKNNRR
ncbi:terminal uridylyltransferase Tailor-like [Galleria mellonella]|uniref:Terminal uridylyltransferase Tailor-like n=1 Tax=Galleria mellonella TaxID=7137 RepID=A0A6J1WNC1_GALME|nr:terminal uridylyltransferase Tailor-like [Galleria mellonella]